MAFKKRENAQRKMQLISLMDVVFILLIFFLVSIFFASLPNEERKLFIPTPKNEPGYAQVLVQLIDDKSFFYIDPFITEELVKELSKIDNQTYKSPAQRLADKKALLIKNNTYPLYSKGGSVNNLDMKLKNLVQYANKHPEERYFVLIRCPDNLPYSSVIEILQILSQAVYKNIQYGCLGGTIDDIRNSEKIEPTLTREGDVLRRNVVIQF